MFLHKRVEEARKLCFGSISRAVLAMKDEYGFTALQIAEDLGVNVEHVTDVLQRHGRVPFEHATE